MATGSAHVCLVKSLVLFMHDECIKVRPRKCAYLFGIMCIAHGCFICITYNLVFQACTIIK